MSWSFPIGRLFGTELRVHVTFFLLLAFIGISAYQTGGPAVAAEMLVFVLVLFACVVAHEFGHALMARRYGIPTQDVTLLPIGGLARLERMPEVPAQEIAVALAGPAVNVVIFLVLALFVGLPVDPALMSEFDGSLEGFFARVALLNLVLAVFNMLPAFPMDGGRVFRAVLSLFTDRVRATQIAATAGQIAAFLLGGLGLASGNLVLLLVAIFVFIAAGSESQDVAAHADTAKLKARDAMITEFETLAPGDSLQVASATLIRTTQSEFPVIAMEGTIMGVLTRDALFAAMLAEETPPRDVSAIMTTGVPSVGLTERLDHVFDALRSAPAVLVTGRSGQLVGYINRENIGETMMLRSRS